MERGGYVYILTNKSNKVLYTGVTSDLESRVYQHKQKEYPDSFSARYELNKLIYYEKFNFIEDAIKREKQIKGGSRNAKIDLVSKKNPFWNDLSSTWI